MNTLETVVWGIYAGAILGFAGTVYAKRVPGSVVRALEKAEAFGEANAKTFAELGLKPTAALRRELRFGKPLRRYVAALNDEATVVAPTPDPKSKRFLRKLFSLKQEPKHLYRFDSQKWYLREESRYEAAVRYDLRGFNVPMIILGSVLLLAVAVMILLVFPHIADYYQAALKAITG